jgi:hypothetical protein
MVADFRLYQTLGKKAQRIAQLADLFLGADGKLFEGTPALFGFLIALFSFLIAFFSFCLPLGIKDSLLCQKLGMPEQELVEVVEFGYGYCHANGRLRRNAFMPQ